MDYQILCSLLRQICRVESIVIEQETEHGRVDISPDYLCDLICERERFLDRSTGTVNS